MNDLFTLGAEPVDLVAARLLFKSPWWAKAPEEIRLDQKKLETELEFFIDLFKAPPPEVPNRIGELCHDSMIIGYAWKGHRVYKKGKPERKLTGLKYDCATRKHQNEEMRKESNGHLQVWYLLSSNGIVQAVRGNTINRWQRASNIEWEGIRSSFDRAHRWQQFLKLIM